MAIINENAKALARTHDEDLSKYEEVDLQRSSSRTYIGLVLDSSGSMARYRQEAISGYNLQLQAIRKASEHEVRVWMSLFGTRKGIDWPIDRGEVADLYDLTWKNYRPSGSTPLLDAIGETIDRLSSEDTGSPREAFLLIAFSDGQENASQKWSWGSLSVLIKMLSNDERWTFVFVGPKSEHLMFEKAGFKPENLLEWDSGKLPELMAKTSKGIERFLKERNVGGLLKDFFGG